MFDIRATFAAVLLAVDALSLAYIIYRTLIGLLGLRPIRPLALASGETRFLVLIPARDEAEVIAQTVECVQGLAYDMSRVSLFVVADNCVDDTAALATAASASVLVKTEPSTSKGSVIQWALAHREIEAATWDALVILDADSRPAADFFAVMDGALAAGECAIQARSESHAQKGWVPTAYAMNTTQRNRNWHQAREAAGFSAALTGTGMCLTRQLLSEHPMKTQTLTEDLEYGARLTAAGVRVCYLYDAVTVIDQPPTLAASVGQRLRWARGQLITAFLVAPSLVKRSLTRLDYSALDTALYLFLPSIVPLQAFVLFSMFMHFALGGVWLPGTEAGLFTIPVGIYLFVLVFTLLMPSIGLHVEGRRYHFRDWVAFALLMLTWIAIAFVAAFTTWVGTWHRTPRTKGYGTTTPAFHERDAVPTREPATRDVTR